MTTMLPAHAARIKRSYVLIILTNIGNDKFYEKRIPFNDVLLSELNKEVEEQGIAYFGPAEGGGVGVDLEWWKAGSKKGAQAAFYKELEVSDA